MIAHYVKQERFHHELLTTEHAKKELMKDINVENQRVNVDSAKKKACIQCMDYNGFRQMVLGANLMPSKAGQLTSIFNPTKGGGINQHSTL